MNEQAFEKHPFLGLSFLFSVQRAVWKGYYDNSYKGYTGPTVKYTLLFSPVEIALLFSFGFESVHIHTSGASSYMYQTCNTYMVGTLSLLFLPHTHTHC